MKEIAILAAIDIALMVGLGIRHAVNLLYLQEY